MRKWIYLWVIAVMPSLQMASQNSRYVDPFIGTDGTGHTFPGPSMPFGMVQPGPDCKDTDWNYTSGYQYADTTVLGFSQTHLSGTGIGELGDILLLPYSRESDKNILRKETEEATAGYYTVTKSDGVKVELTCSEHVAFHQYKYPSRVAFLQVDLQHGLRFMTDSLVLDSDIKIEDNYTISGYCHTKNWVERRYAFVLKLNIPFKEIVQLPYQQKDQAPRYQLKFALKDASCLKVKIALSTTSVAGAKKNMQAEIPHWNFDQIRSEAEVAWNKYLNRLVIESDDTQKKLFYTSVYHLLLQPSNIADVDGKYRGADDKIHTSKSLTYYSTLSNWDIYRAAFPLLQLLVPEKIDDMIVSMLEHHKVAGFLPIWSVWGQDNYCMIGNHAIPMIVSAYQNGFRGFDAEEAKKAVVETSVRPHIHSDWEIYTKYGYYPFDLVEGESVSKALENGYDDWCVAYLARCLGDEDTYSAFMKRAGYYHNLYDKETRLFRGKDSKGGWRIPFDPYAATSPMNNPGDYTEANAWQYFWTPAQYDIEGVKKLLGGKAAFTKHLDEFFSTRMANPNKYLGQEAMIGQYAHGNEPCHHIAYLYAFSDKPWKGQSYINRIVKEFYRPTPDGMLGNDDCGQMSAWYILSCLGIYPLNPATGEFVLGAPQVKKAALLWENGNRFEFTADNFSDKNICVEDVSLNGNKISNIINYRDIMKGGTLQFSMKAPIEALPMEAYMQFPFGSIKPEGWLKVQMKQDMEGILENLEDMIPELIQDPIYSTGRLTSKSKVKDLGNNKEGDAEGEEQYKWWNSETQSNWRDAYIRNAILLKDSLALDKVFAYVSDILKTQDKDGYLGIYAPEIRYHFNKENGELWSKATLYRGLLAYYEATGDTLVRNALIRAVDNVMENWPIYQSHPFDAGKEYNGGVAHGLTFTDVLDRIYQLTGNQKYRDYALFLYRDYSSHFSSESDAQLSNILDDDYKLSCHGVHTYEHLRPLIVSAYSTKDDSLKIALDKYLQKISMVTTPTGGAIGDEWIAGKKADPTHTGYEYCSLHELLDSYSVLLQKRGNKEVAEQIENIFYNAAQGARHPYRSGIAYLKTDNSFEMLGTRNGYVEPDRKQTRYKYSPVHQDVAVCCVPNAMRISPYFIQKAWMQDNNGVLICHLLLPNTLETEIDGKKVRVKTETNYPNEHIFNFQITTEKPLQIKIRKPDWSTSVSCSVPFKEENGYLWIECSQAGSMTISLEYFTKVRVIEDAAGHHYFAYGAQIFALPFESEEIEGRVYKEGFCDYTYKPLNNEYYKYVDNHEARYENGKIIVTLFRERTGERVERHLVPIKQTILRQVAF